jgi:hypothetical protein
MFLKIELSTIEVLYDFVYHVDALLCFRECRLTNFATSNDNN